MGIYVRAAIGDEGRVWECEGLLSAGLDSFWSVNQIPSQCSSLLLPFSVWSTMLQCWACPAVLICHIASAQFLYWSLSWQKFTITQIHNTCTSLSQQLCITLLIQCRCWYNMAATCSMLCTSSLQDLRVCIQILSHPRSMTSVKLAWLGPLCMWVTPSRAGALPSAATAPSCAKSVPRYWKHKRSCRYIAVPLSLPCAHPVMPAPAQCRQITKSVLQIR